MKKALFFMSFLVALVSCNYKKTKELAATYGEINTISVLIDDKLWDSEVGDSIRNKFAAPVLGLPQEEPLFTIKQFPVKLFEGFMNNSRNIIVIKKESKNEFLITENQFAKPQNVYSISGKNSTSIINLLEENAPRIIKKIRHIEILANQKKVDTLLFDDTKIRSKFKVSLKIPKDFKYALKSTKFLWLKKEITSGNTSLLIYQRPFSDFNLQKNTVQSIVNSRDSIGNLYLHGRSKYSKMKTEDAYAPYLSYTVLDKRYAFETKGTWEMNNDYMNGPFVNYTILDKPNKRILVLCTI
jgi:Domain of unknown function (DUF4837)